MATLCDYFIRGRRHDGLDDPEQAIIYGATCPKGSQQISVDTRWRGMVTTILHELKDAESGGRFRFFSSTSRDDLILNLPNIIRDEWKPKSFLNEDGDGTIWELGKIGWRGYPLFQLSVTEMGRLSDFAKLAQCSPFSSGMKFKKLHRTSIEIGTLFFDDGMVSFGRISTIYDLICFPKPSIDFGMTNKLFWSFADPWEEWTPNERFRGMFDCLHAIENRLVYRLRMLAVHKDASDQYQHEKSGLSLCRLKGKFPSWENVTPGSFQERRISLSLYTRSQNLPNVVPRAKLIVLADTALSDFRFLGEGQDLQVPGWHWCHYIFNFHVRKRHMIWQEEWTRCLDKIDQSIKVKAEEVLNPEVIEDLMFDKSFARSKLYFTTLQLLRIFSDMIRETGRELRDTSEYFFSEKFYLKMRSHWGGPENIQDLVESWKGILSLHQAAEEKLLDRIQSKTAEIESLRERLFNATSVRETSRSTSMNRAVIVFTIVTVTYLPASFIATIFGTQLFNDEDIAGTINKFKITTIVVSITTFVLAILLVLLAANLHRIKRSSIYRKWNGKMHQHGKVMENDETRSRGEELSNRRRDQVPQGRLQSLRNRFRQRPKKNENP